MLYIIFSSSFSAEKYIILFCLFFIYGFTCFGACAGFMLFGCPRMILPGGVSQMKKILQPCNGLTTARDHKTLPGGV